MATSVVPERWAALLHHPVLRRPAVRWGAAWLALVAVYWICSGSGQVWDVDSIRDGSTALDIIERGILPRRGPEVGKLGFFLSSLYFYVLAAELLVWRSMSVFAWVSVLIQATSALSMVALVKRIVGTRVAWISLLLFIGSSAVYASQGLFTHASYSVVCELIGLNALYDAKVMGKSRRFIPALFFLSAAAQFHMAVFPLLFFAAVFSVTSGHDVEWKDAIRAWVAALLPLLPELGQDAMVTGVHSLQPVEAIVWTLDRNNALVPSLLCVLLIARPSLLWNRAHLRKFALCWIGWLIWIGLESRASGSFPVIKLFNIELHRPVPGDPIAANANVSAVFAHLWTFWIFSDGRFVSFYAALMVVGAVYAWLRWEAIRRTDDALSPETDRLARRFFVLWLMIVAPLNLIMYFGAPTPQSRYLTHLGLLVILLIGIGIDAMGELIQRGLPEVLGRLRDTAESDLRDESVVVLAGLPERPQPPRARRLPSTVMSMSVMRASRALRLPRTSGAKRVFTTSVWTIGLLIPAPLHPFLYPVAFRAVGLARIAIPFALLSLAIPLYARHQETSSDSFQYIGTMKTIFRLAEDLKLGDDFETRLHGTGPAAQLGDMRGTPWYMFARLRKPQPSSDADPSTHYFLRRIKDDERAAQNLLPGTHLQLTSFHPQLHLEKAQLAAGAKAAMETLSQSLPLPLRIASPGQTPEPRGVRFVQDSPFFDDNNGPLVNAAITIPRSGGSSGSVLHLLLSDVASDNSRCRAKVLVDGNMVGDQQTGSSPAAALEFALPAAQQSGVVRIEFAACRFSFIDVFDVPVKVQ